MLRAVKLETKNLPRKPPKISLLAYSIARIATSIWLAYGGSNLPKASARISRE